MNMRQATAEDIKSGATVFDSSGNEFLIKNKYSDGIYETNKPKVMFVNEAKYYFVAA